MKNPAVCPYAGYPTPHDQSDKDSTVVNMQPIKVKIPLKIKAIRDVKKRNG